MQPSSMIIAVDGPAASGKGTLSRRIARKFGLAYLDTGSLYRGVALMALEAGIDLADIPALAQLTQEISSDIWQDPRIREPGVGDAASKIASIADVRAGLLAFQRDFANQPPGAVLDGRDIGTVVCPDADVKLFVTASEDERARRRHKELVAAGKTVTFEEIKADILRRDGRDASRNTAPLVQSEDAHLLDTTNLDIDAAMSAAVDLINQAIDAKNGTRS